MGAWGPRGRRQWSARGAWTSATAQEPGSPGVAGERYHMGKPRGRTASPRPGDRLASSGRTYSDHTFSLTAVGWPGGSSALVPGLPCGCMQLEGGLAWKARAGPIPTSGISAAQAAPRSPSAGQDRPLAQPWQGVCGPKPQDLSRPGLASCLTLLRCVLWVKVSHQARLDSPGAGEWRPPLEARGGGVSLQRGMWTGPGGLQPSLQAFSHTDSGQVT